MLAVHFKLDSAGDFGIGIGTRAFTPFEPQDESHYWASFGHLNGYSAIYYT